MKNCYSRGGPERAPSGREFRIQNTLDPRLHGDDSAPPVVPILLSFVIPSPPASRGMKDPKGPFQGGNPELSQQTKIPENFRGYQIKLSNLPC